MILPNTSHQSEAVPRSVDFCTITLPLEDHVVFCNVTVVGLLCEHWSSVLCLSLPLSTVQWCAASGQGLYIL